MTSEQIKHLEFIQGIINRMNSNSFSIKGWAITIVSALLALYASSSNVTYIFIAIMPTILFWFLDAYYLRQERRFRGLYKDIVNNGASVKLFDMPIKNYNNGEFSYCCVFWSRTIAPLYGLISIALLIIGLILKCNIIICCNCC